MNKSTFKLLLAPILAVRRRTLMIALALLLLSTLSDVAGPYLIKHYIDDFLVPQNYQINMMFMLAGIYLTTFMLASVFRYMQSIIFANIALDTIFELRKRLFNHVLSLPTSWHDNAISGQTLSRVTNDTESLKELYVDFLATVISGSILLVGILIGMALLNVQLMLIALMMIPIVIIMVTLYQKKSGKAVADVRAKRAEQNIHISEAINGMSVLQSMNQTGRYAQSFAKVNDEQYLARIRQIRASGLYLRPAMDFISTAILAGVILVFGHQVIGGEAQIGVLYGFILYLGRFIEPLVDITQRFSIFQSAMVAGKRINDLLQVDVQSNGQDNQPIVDAHMKIKGLTFAYKENENVLNDLNVDIPLGKFVAVVGRTGSGKSTFLSLLLGHYPVQQGSIEIDNRSLNELTEACRTQCIGLIPQEPFIKVGTLKENILMGRKINNQALEQAIDDAQLRPLIQGLPLGLDTELGEGGANLSSGQRQLVAMARALAAKPSVLILDEATASLDSQTEVWVQKALMRLKGSVTLIVVAHRLSTIRDADEILVLSHGNIIERGNHRELLSLPDGYYSKLNQYQQEEQLLEKISE